MKSMEFQIIFQDITCRCLKLCRPQNLVLNPNYAEADLCLVGESSNRSCFPCILGDMEGPSPVSRRGIVGCSFVLDFVPHLKLNILKEEHTSDPPTVYPGI